METHKSRGQPGFPFWDAAARFECLFGSLYLGEAACRVTAYETGTNRLLANGKSSPSFELLYECDRKKQSNRLFNGNR